MEKLKPCPFCGGKARMWSWNGGTRIDCENWNANNAQTHFVGIGARTKEEAIKAWNRQTVPETTRILADALDGTPLLYPCDKLWSPEGWCKDHCKPGQQEPDTECWLKYAEVLINEQQTEGE